MLLSVTATEVVMLTMLPPFETADDARVLLDEPAATLVMSVVPDALRVAVVAARVLEILFNTVLATPRVWPTVMPSLNFLVDADPPMVVALIAIVDVIRLRDVDKPSVPPPSPCWSRDVCLVCLALVLLSVAATEMAVLTMLPDFKIADDATVLLVDTVGILVA